MKRPGDTGRQGIDIEALDTDPEMDRATAVDHARTLGADVTPEGRVLPGFVTKAIDFREGEVFVYEKVTGEELVFEVASSRQFTSQLKVTVPGQNAARGYRPQEWSEFDDGYTDLWVAWLQGRVAPVDTETRYVRMDTGEEVEP